jgi:hypothetical protein
MSIMVFQTSDGGASTVKDERIVIAILPPRAVGPYGRRSTYLVTTESRGA